MRVLVLTLSVLFAGAALAAPKRVAVLPLQNSAEVTGGEIRYLTNLVRKGAMRSLSAAQFTVMTEENMEAMLPPGKTLADCVAKASCAVDIGKEMKAHYVVTGELVRFGKSLRLSVKVHVTQTKGFLEQIDAKGSEIEAFESALETRAAVLFAAIQKHAGGAAPSLGAASTVSTGAAPKAPSFEVSGAAEAVVRFESTPSNAQVTLNGAVVCSTPCSQTVAQGRHQVAMAQLGYVTTAEQVLVAENMTVRWTLTKNRGVMVLRSTPEGQPVRILSQGKALTGTRTTPATVEVAPGRYEVIVGDPACAKPHTKTVVVKLGETAEVDFQPAVLQAGLKVKVFDAKGNGIEGQLHANGAKLGSTLKPHKVPVCSTGFEVRVDGQAPVSFTPSLVAQETVERTVSLNGHPFQVGQRWIGEYRCGQGVTALALGITAVEADQVDVQFSFDFRGDPPARGSYRMAGAVGVQSSHLPLGAAPVKSLQLKPAQWIVRPPGYEMVGLKGTWGTRDGKPTFSGQVVSASKRCSTFQVTLKDQGEGLGLPPTVAKSPGLGDAISSGVKFGWKSVTGIFKGGAQLLAGDGTKARRKWPRWARKVPPLCAVGKSERRMKKRRAQREAERRARDALVVALSEILPARSLDTVAAKRNGKLFVPRKSRVFTVRKGKKKGARVVLSLVCAREGGLDNLVRATHLAQLKQLEAERRESLGHAW